MMMPLLFAVLGGLSLIVVGLGYKHASVVKSPVGAHGSVFGGVAFLLTFAYSFFEPTDWLDWRLWAVGLVGSALFMLAVGFYTRANRVGPLSTSWVVLNLSCVLSIFLAAVFLPDEKWVWLDAPIVALFVGMIFTLHAGMKQDGAGETKGRVHPLFWPLVLGAFVFNGVFLFLLKIKAAALPVGHNGAMMAICFGAAGAIMAACHALACRRRNEIPWKKHDFAAGLMLGFGAGLGNIFVLKAMSLPAVVVLPVCQGLPMIGGVVAMAILYRERFNRAKIAGLLLVCALLLLTVFRDKVMPQRGPGEARELGAEPGEVGVNLNGQE